MSRSQPAAAIVAKPKRQLPPALAARMWQPGQSGNPNGPSGEYWRCVRLCREASYAAAEEIIRLSQTSEDDRVRYMAATWLYERAWGKPREYDPAADGPDPPRFDPRQYTSEELGQIETALKLLIRRQRPKCEFR